MPVASLIGTSQLLMEGGWVSAEDWSGQSLLGLDRHGRLEEAAVAVRDSGHCAAAYLGTRYSIAEVASEASFVDANGRKVRIGQLIQDGVVSDHRFETVWPTTIDNTSGTANGLWRALCQLAIARKEGAIAIAPGIACPDTVDTNGVLVIRRQDISLDLGRLKGLFEAVLERRTDGEEGYLFDRSEIGLLVWLLTTWRLANQRYSLTYDSLQHTSAVRVALEAEMPKRDLKGSCAFLAPGQQNRYLLTWSTHGWNPICSGLILAGSA